MCVFNNQLEKGKSWATLLPSGLIWQRTEQFSGSALTSAKRRERTMK
jgi:hypothetical protein